MKKAGQLTKKSVKERSRENISLQSKQLNGSVIDSLSNSFMHKRERKKFVARMKNRSKQNKR